MKKSKIITSCAFAGMLALTGLPLTGCMDKGAQMKVSDVYAMGMVTASNFLTQDKGTSAKLSTSLADGDKKTLTKYVGMFEGFFDEGIHPVEGEINQGEYGFGVYSKKLTLKLDDVTYTMLYSEVAEGTTTEIDEEEIESETKTFLYGIASKGNIIYNVVGSRVVESESENGVIESENELKLIFSTQTLVASNVDSIEEVDLGKLDNYVYIEQEVQEGEIEFEYTTKLDGVTQTTSIEWENERGREELEVKIQNGANRVKYEITKVANDKFRVKVNSQEGKQKFYMINSEGKWNFVDDNNVTL